MFAKSPVIETIGAIQGTIQGKSFCDLGCDTGDLLMAAGPYTTAVWGVEQVTENANIAKDRIIDAGFNGNVLNGDIYEIALPNVDVYYLFIDVQAFVRMYRRIIKQDIKKTFIFGGLGDLGFVADAFVAKGARSLTVAAGHFNLIVWNRTNG